MPEGFDYPPDVAVWIPRELYPELPGRTAHNWRGLGRVRDGVTIAQARANLSAIARRIKEEYGKEVDLNDAAVVPLADATVGDVRAALLTLLGAPWACCSLWHARTWPACSWRAHPPAGRNWQCGWR